MRNALFGVVVLLSLYRARGFSPSLPHFGRCPDLSVQENFKLEKYMGKWYFQSGYNVESVQGKGRCTQADYVLNSSEGVVEVNNSQISLPSEKWSSIAGTAVYANSSNDEGKLEVTFPIYSWLNVTGPYWVLGTDYTSYTVVYSCRNFLYFFHYYNTWLLSRVQNLSTKQSTNFYNKTDKVLKAHNIDPSIFQKGNQTDCDS